MQQQYSGFLLTLQMSDLASLSTSERDTMLITFPFKHGGKLQSLQSPALTDVNMFVYGI